MTLRLQFAFGGESFVLPVDFDENFDPTAPPEELAGLVKADITQHPTQFFALESAVKVKHFWIGHYRYRFTYNSGTRQFTAKRDQ